MKRERALDAITYDLFVRFATRDEEDPGALGIIEKLILQEVIGLEEPRGKPSQKTREFCATEFRRQAAIDALDRDRPFLSTLKAFIARDNQLLAEWIEWLDPLGGWEF